MAHRIIRIRRQIILLFCAAVVAATLILVVVSPVISDLTPEAVRNERINYLIFTPIFLAVGVALLYLYLRPLTGLGRALAADSTPEPKDVEAARRIAFDAPLYFFVVPTAGALILSLLSDLFGFLVLPDYAPAEHLTVSLMTVVTAACASLAISMIAQHWMRPVLLYTPPQPLSVGRRLNIRARLFSITLILTLAAVLFTGLLAYNQAVIAYREQLGNQAFIYLSRVADAMPPDLAQNQVLDSAMANLRQDVRYEVIFLLDKDGRILDQRTVGETSLAFRAEAWRKERPNTFRQARGYFVIVPLWSAVRPHWIGVGYPVQPLRSPMVVNTLITVSVFGMGMIVLVGVITYYLAASVILDLRFLTQRFLDIANEERVDLTQPVPVLSFDEVGDLILAYNALQKRVHHQQEQIEKEQGQLIALQSLSYKIGNIREVDHLLAEVVQDVERAFGYQNISIWLADQANQEAFLAATNRQDLIGLDRKFRFHQVGAVGQAAELGTPMLVDDVTARGFAIPDIPDIRSEMAVPLLVGERVIGVFDIASSQVSAFMEPDLQVAIALGNQVAIAVENARLIHETLNSAQEVRSKAQNLLALHSISASLSTSLHVDEVLSTATSKLVELFKVDHSTVFLFEAEDQYGEIAAEYPHTQMQRQTVRLKSFPAAQRILLMRQPLFISDAQHNELMAPVRQALQSLRVECMLLVPLQSKGIIMGALTLDAIGRERTFTPDEIDICQTIAAQVAVAVENARLFENMRLQAEMLIRVTKDVSAERSKLDAVLRNLVDGLLVTDPTGRVLIANPSFLSLFNLGQQHLEGEYISNIVPQLPLQHLVIQTGYDRTVYVQEFVLDDGRFLQCTSAVVYEEEQVSGVVLVLRDITREKRLDQLKSDFISSVSHELRTPLTIVSGFSHRIHKSFERLAATWPANASNGEQAIRRIANNIENLLSGVRRLENLVEDVLIIADMDAGRFEWHIGEVKTHLVFQAVADKHRSQATEKGVGLEADIPADLPNIEGDGERLALVLDNLITNAIKFTDQGQVVIHAQAIRRQGKEWSPAPVVTVPGQLTREAYVLVVVRDTGIGISPGAQQTLFERFGQGMRDVLTDKPAGTGLGLTISQEIVRYHGGHIWVESELGKGSTFAFAIPFLFKPGTSPDSRSPVQAAPMILAVDDEEGIRELLQYILSEAGYRTLVAPDGLTGLNMARLHKPDLILMDLMMPGLSGFDAIGELKRDRTTQDIPIVVLSILADPQKALQLGADACLAKPVEQDVLLSTLVNLLNRQRQTQQMEGQI